MDRFERLSETEIPPIEKFRNDLKEEDCSPEDYEFFKKIRPLDSDIRGDVLLLFTVAAVTIVYFSSFDAPLRRTMADDEVEGEGEEGGASMGAIDVAAFASEEEKEGKKSLADFIKL